MNADGFRTRLTSAFIFIFLLGACAPTATPTLYRPPGAAASATPVYYTSVVVPPIPPATRTPIPETPTPLPPCTDELKWLADLTYLDDTIVLPGQAMEKQWQVQNSGTCDWDARYRLRNINGELLGAAAEIPLYPARAGATVTLTIVFVAPNEAGSYRSEWQAVSPAGILFGDTVYIKIVAGENQ